MDAVACGRKIRERFSPCSLATWPTPLDSAPALAHAAALDALWVKREDAAGGNKVRGLEFLLSDAPPGTIFVTVGGTGSTHCVATAKCAHALQQGYRVALAQFPQPETPESRAMAAAATAHGDVVVRSRTQLGLPAAIVRAWWAALRMGAGGGQRRWIPGGGAHPRAVLGHLIATLELATQLDAPPDAIVLPLGTGGTAAGIALGLALLGWMTQIVAVRVAPLVVANRWRTLRLGRQAGRLLTRAGIVPRVPDLGRLSVVDGLGPGYGHPTREGELACALAERHGLALDPTYGAKAFAHLLRSGRVDMRRAVFWHTFAWP